MTLKPTTAYIPVPVEERLPERTAPVIYYNGKYSAMTAHKIEQRVGLIIHWLDRRENVYVLTREEMLKLLDEAYDAGLIESGYNNFIEQKLGK